MSIPSHGPIDPEHCATCKIYCLEQRVKELEAAAALMRPVVDEAISWANSDEDDLVGSVACQMALVMALVDNGFIERLSESEIKSK